MANFTLFRAKKGTRTLRELDVSPDVHRALLTLRNRVMDYELLLAAVRVAAIDGDAEGAIRAFCEDYGIDQVDPVRKIDVLRHALKLLQDRIILTDDPNG